jgi:hypothetical protein
MSADSEAALSLLPWVRQGAAAAITVPDNQSTTQPGVASIDVTLRINDAPLPATSVQLRGPADVLGIEANQVLRTDPRAGSMDFESNCFASIEFDRADFPWLFTPARANASSQLRPWLCLVVVRKQPGVQLSSSVDSPLPILQIATPADYRIELPDLGDCWAWAHAQAAVDDGSVRDALNGSPDRSLSRLICPRLLAPDTEYMACVVPTFEAGRKAGLGLALVDRDFTTLAYAWTIPGSSSGLPATVQLPVYYHWSFRTGAGGDFAALASNLKSEVPDGLGLRKIDISQPGFPYPLPPDYEGTPHVFVEGALLPLTGPSQPVLWADPIVAPTFEAELAKIVNQPGVSEVAAPDADPLLAPPLYGRWHAGANKVIPGAAPWFDELNLDPRWRVVAAIGTRVVQEHQETLMASAWNQAAEMAQVNQRMRQLQLSLAVNERLHARHLAALDTEEKVLRIAAPAFSRIREQSGAAAGLTLTAKLTGSALPVPAVRAAMRRIGRLRGPLTRRIAKQGFDRASDITWVANLNLGINFPAPPAHPGTDYAWTSPPPPVTGSSVRWNPGFQIAAEGAPLANIPALDRLPATWDYPGHFRAAIANHVSRLRWDSPVVEPSPPLEPTRDTVLAEMQPRPALAKLARSVAATADTVLSRNAPGVTAIGLETVMMAPSFPQPMYEPLKELSQELLLPGLDKVKPESVLALKTNRAFVDAYLVGLNFEMGRELLWRGFPTDQRGTYFRHFWGHDAGLPEAAAIDDLLTWGQRSLGAATANASTEAFVLLLRTSLLRRYPNALIYLTPALPPSQATTSAPDVLPIFNGSMDPDVSFFGFPISPEAAIGSATAPGYFVVIQEHPTEPRFGIDAGLDFGGASHLRVGAQPQGSPGFTWGSHAAQIAGMTRRLPVRIAIHASQLISV